MQPPKRVTGFLYAFIGLILVPIIHSNWVTKLAGWLLQAIVHEAGHTLMALAMGRPALPRISLDGHVPFTMIADRRFPLFCLIVWLALVYLAVNAWQSRVFRVTTIAIVILYPLLALSARYSELAVLLAGHGAELLFAGICLFRAQTGLFTQSTPERAAYAIVGWYLVFSNFFMCLGILHDPATRAAYIAGSDPAIVNDYVVAAYDILGLTSITPVVLGMLIASIAVYPLALLYAAKLQTPKPPPAEPG